MKRVTLCVAAVLGILGLAGAASAEIKVGVVDLQRALNESASGKKAKEQFKVEFDRMQDSLRREKDSLDRMKDDLEKKAAVLKEEQRKSMTDDFERRRRELRRKLEDSDAELRKKDSELTGGILRDLATVIQEIGQRDGYTIILESSASAVLYGSKSIDITEEVIRTFDAQR